MTLLHLTGELLSELSRRLSERKVGVTPMSLLQGLRSEVEKRKKIFKNQVIVPANYTVQMSDQDYGEFAPYAEGLQKEFIAELNSYIHQHSFSCGQDSVLIALEKEDSLTKGQFGITSQYAARDSGLGSRVQPPSGWVNLEIRCHGKSFATLMLADGEYLLGRGQDADIRLPADDLLLSKKHCRLNIEEGSVWVEDLQSSNGTYLNGENVVTSMNLLPGDCLLLGSTEVKVRW